MSINWSTPRRRKIGSIGSPSCVAVPMSTTKDPRDTPAIPLLVSMSVSIIMTCWPALRCMPAACATNMAARERYRVPPSMLKL